jgi:hypothetical protein
LTDSPPGFVASSGRQTEAALLSQAKPELVRVNAFRLTQLPTTASQQEVARQVERLAMAEKYGVAAQGEQQALLPVPGGVPAAKLREAIQRLRDPEIRLVDEVFWFWHGDQDRGISALKAGNADRAAREWTLLESSGGAMGGGALHNLAVLALTTAVDQGLDVRDGAADGRTSESMQSSWKAALERWGVLVESDEFWALVVHRIGEIGDPRLSADEAAVIRRTLPEALARVSATLADSLWSAGHKKAGEAIFAELRESRLPQADVTSGVKVAVEPLRQRLAAALAASEGEAERATGQEAKLEAARLLLERCEPLLAELDAALPHGDPNRAALHDGLATAVLRVAASFSMPDIDAENRESFEHWVAWASAMSPLLERASGIAEGDAARAQIEALHEQLQDVVHGIEQALEESAAYAALEPLVQRLADAVAEADTEAERAGHENAKLKAALLLLQRGEPLLAELDAALPHGDSRRQTLHDGLAMAVVRVAGSSIPELTAENRRSVEKWYSCASAAEQLVAQASVIAAGAEARAQIMTIHAQVRKTVREVEVALWPNRAGSLMGAALSPAPPKKRRWFW